MGHFFVFPFSIFLIFSTETMERISSRTINSRNTENYSLLLENYKAKIKLLSENCSGKHFIKRMIYLLKLGKDFQQVLPTNAPQKKKNNYAQAVELLYQDTKKSCPKIFLDDKNASYSSEALVQSVGSRPAFLFAFIQYSKTKEFSYQPFEVPLIYEFKEKKIVIPFWSDAEYALKFAETNQHSTSEPEQIKEYLRAYLIAMAYIHSMNANNSTQIENELKPHITHIEIKINHLKNCKPKACSIL